MAQKLAARLAELKRTARCSATKHKSSTYASRKFSWLPLCLCNILQGEKAAQGVVVNGKKEKLSKYV
jgi:hypothetical protein